MKPDRIIAVRNRKTIYRDGGMCLKVFAPDYPKEDIFSEAVNQARAERTGLKVPPVREVCHIDGRLAIVSDFIGGRTLAELISENPENKEKYLSRFCALQLEMHEKSCPGMCRLTDKLNTRISQTTLSATDRFRLHTHLGSMPQHTNLCHGDFDPSNIIIADSGEAYITDWAHAALGNTSADAARTYLLFLLCGDNDAADKYLGLFCAKSDTDPKSVREWIPVIAAAQLARGNKAEREFLRKQIKNYNFNKQNGGSI